MYAVESKVPLIGSSRGAGAGVQKYPFPNMKIDDSFGFNGDQVNAERVRCAAKGWAQKHGGKFTVRKIKAGQYRCWRIA